MPQPYRVNKAGRFGFISPSDLRPHELPKEAWNNVRNIRMANGAAEVVPNRVQGAFMGDLAVSALEYYSGPSQHRIAFSNDKIFTIDAADNVLTVNDLGGDAIAYPNQVWVTDRFNSIPIATSRKGPPLCQYAGGGLITEATPFVPFPDWENPGDTYVNHSCLGVAAYKSFIVAFNIIGTADWPNLVLWSDDAEPGLMPATWEISPSTLAGRRVVGAEDGVLLCARQQRDSLIIYAERGTYRMTFVPGSDLVMDVTKIFDNFGAFGPRSAGSYGSQHLVVTKDDVITHDGQTWKSVGEERVRDRIFQGLTEEDTNEVYVTPYLKKSEMFIGVANQDNDFLTALTWKWSDEGRPWSLRDLPDSRHVARLPVLEASTVEDQWDSEEEEEWDTGRANIWDEGSSLGDFQLVACSTEGYLYSLDDGPQTLEGFLERDDINLSGDETTETLTALIPRIKSSGTVEITVGASQTVEGPISWEKPAIFDPNKDYRITRLATGRRHAVRFRGLDLRLEGYDIQWEYAGER